MISHITLGVGDIDDAMTFYRQFMEVIGWDEKFATRRSPPGPWAGFHPAGADRPLADSGGQHPLPIPFPEVEEQQLRANLTDLVREDPEKAARILNQWIARAG